jgi:hypothetical protein
VYGQDHIGYIILVYTVKMPDDGDIDFGSFNQHSSPHSSGLSKGADWTGAGVVFSETLRFVRRIRHPALGGHMDYESLHLSANERFIVVNTKLGHELEGRHGADGLLVIDVDRVEEYV